MSSIHLKSAGYDVILSYKYLHKYLGIVAGEFPTFSNQVNRSIKQLTSNINAFDFEVVAL